MLGLCVPPAVALESTRSLPLCMFAKHTILSRYLVAIATVPTAVLNYMAILLAPFGFCVMLVNIAPSAPRCTLSRRA